MVMMMRGEIIFVMVAAVVLASLGCIGGGPEEKKMTTLRIGYQPSTHQVAEMVAMEMGWWEEDLLPFGIEKIEEYQFPSGPPEMQSMLAGDLDVAYVGSAPPISAIAQGLDAKIVAAAQINGSNLVLRPEISYDGPKSLVGKKIGTFPPGSIQSTVIRKWLMDNDVNPDDVEILPMGPGDAVTAITAGKVAGVFLPTPSPSKIELEGNGVSVIASGEMWPSHSCCCLVASGELMREHPELLDEILRIHIRATEYANDYPDEAAKIFSNRTGEDLSVVEHSLANWDGRLITDPHVQIPSTLAFAAVNYDLGFATKNLTEDELFDTSFYDSVA